MSEGTGTPGGKPPGAGKRPAIGLQLKLPCASLDEVKARYGDDLKAGKFFIRTKTPRARDTLVRLDVTYLRQDFSVMQPVADAHPWPEMQRFDFLVRTRPLTEAEARAYREKLDHPRQLSPYQRATLTALRELTGKDAEPTAEAWRRLLGLPERQQRTALAR